MFRGKRLVAVILLVHCGVGCELLAQSPPARHVVLVSIDGLAASYLDDPRADLPALRRLRRIGAAAKGMVTTFPSVTWPAHTTIITGTWPARHGIIGNSVIDRNSGKEVVYIGDPVFTKEQCVRVPTLYDAVHHAGMTAGAIIWPATNGAPTLRWSIPDSNRADIHRRFTTPGLVEELRRANISITRLAGWGWDHRYAAARDWTYAQVARYLLKTYRPNLLMVHLITPDAIEHDYGPATEEAYWACRSADDRIRDIWEAIQEPPFQHDAALVVVSDHGFAPYDKVIHPNVVFARRGWIQIDPSGKTPLFRVRSLSAGGAAQVYVLDQDHKQELLSQLEAVLKELPGVDQVLRPSEFARYGLPDPGANAQQADLIATAKPGFAFGNDIQGSPVVSLEHQRGAHGHLPDQPFMHALFVAAGAGISPHKSLGVIQAVDVAPTIARLLGVPFPSADGRPLPVGP